MAYRTKATLPSLGSVSINYYCCAADMYDLYDKLNEFNRQKEITHLGIVSQEFDGASHTRYEYLMLQCALSDVLDKLYKGVVAQGTIKIDGKQYSGNGVLKSWFMLSNMGHLKNTFGDEKTLIQYAKKRKGFVSKLLAPIRSERLRGWCHSIIDNFEYQKFHYVIALHRMYKGLPRRLEKQDELAKIAELLLLDKHKINSKVNFSRLDQLRSLFKRIRDMAIVTIDGHYSHSQVSIDLFSSIISFDEKKHSSTEGWNASSVTPLRKILTEDIYLNKNVLANQRSYEVQALQILNEFQNIPESYENIIEIGIESGFVRKHRRTLYHFYRVLIPSEFQPSTSFYDEFRNIVIKARKNCPKADAYLDLNPFTGTRYIDFFVTEDFQLNSFPKLLDNILGLLKDQFNELIKKTTQEYNDLLRPALRIQDQNAEESDEIKELHNRVKDAIAEKVWLSAEKNLFPCYRDLLWSLISYFVKDKYKIEIESPSLPYDYYAMSTPEFGTYFFNDTLERALEHEIESDKDRAHEIAMVKRLTKRRFDGYKVAFLVRIKVLDLSEPPERMLATDIDAAVLKVNRESFSLELCEAKNKKRKQVSTARKELKENFVKILNKKARYKIKSVEGYGASLQLKV